MNPQSIDLNKIGIASPCSVGWDSMAGDDRKRFCESCELNVYNVSGMTGDEVHQLISDSNGRLCMRLRRRADGTLITKDCPIGLRAYQKRVGRFAGATLAAILGLFSISFGQKEDSKPTEAAKLRIVRTATRGEKSELTGTIVNQYGSLIPGAKLLFVNEKGEKSSFATNGDGRYSILSISNGEYSLDVYSTGFKKLRITHIKIGGRERLEMNLELKADGENVTVGVLASSESPDLETTTSGISDTITVAPRKLEKLPTAH